MDYEKALEKAKERYLKIKGTNSDEESFLLDIFPELKGTESEGEKIRKELYDFCIKCSRGDTLVNQQVDFQRWAAWLEKQSGVDNVPLEWSVNTVVTDSNKPNHRKPRFNEGDWVVLYDSATDVDKKVVQISRVEKTKSRVYEYWTKDGRWFGDGTASRLWTIEDAKDGDVLAFYSEYKGNKMVQVGIIEKYVGKHGGCSNSFKIYVGVNWENNLQLGKYMGCSDIRPATKEQRDILFQKMKEAGYKWDDKKKEIYKVVIDEGKSEIDRNFTEMMLGEKSPLGVKRMKNI